jgi:hypothetical protein
VNKLRLLLTDVCNRNCRGCCNKLYDLKTLPVCTDFTCYDQILLTGGEPMLQPWLVVEAIGKLRRQTQSPIYLYTADTTKPIMLLLILSLIEGITVTLHEPKDVEPFLALDPHIQKEGKSLRLNVFKRSNYTPHNLTGWVVKSDLSWIRYCPLPEGEVFMRYEH